MKRTKGSIKWEKSKARRDRKNGGKKFCYVYALVDSEGNVRYIGQTRMALRARRAFHVKGCRQRPDSKLSIWFMAKNPDIIMLDENATWDVSEILWIDHYRRQGANLLNILRGGQDTIHSVRREGADKRLTSSV